MLPPAIIFGVSNFYLSTMAEEEDQVIEEVDVYLSKGLAENLYLFQYPVRPASMPYDDFEHLAARIKPQQRKVEIELGIDTMNPNYSKSKGEQIAINVDGTALGSMGSTYESNMMDKQVLTSTNMNTSTSRYAVGILRDGELHLTPLCGIVQLRPSFSYLDKAENRDRQLDKANAEGESSQSEAEEEAKPVKVQFVRAESDQAKARRMASYQYLEQKLGEEPWKDVTFCSKNDSTAHLERDKLFSQSNESEVSRFQIPSKEYLTMLIPESSEGVNTKPQMPNNVLSISQLKSMSLTDQVLALLKNAKVLRFSQLITILPGNPDPIAMLRALQQGAALVQGCWVVKSDVLYPKDTCSPISGVPAEILCRGRDYVMWRFTQSRCIVRKEVASITKLPSEDMKDILEQMARPKVNQGWEFAIEYDKDFVDQHSEVVQRQQMIWDAKYQQLTKVLKVPKNEGERRTRRDSVAGTAEVSPGQARAPRSRSKSQSKDKSPVKQPQAVNNSHTTTMQGKELNLTGDSAGVILDNGSSLPVSSGVRIKTEPLDVRIKSEPTDKPVPMDTGNTAKSHTNGPLQNSVDVESTSNDVRAALRTFLLEKFNNDFVLSVSELRKMLLFRLSEIPADDPLNAGVSDRDIEECAIEVGAVQMQMPWPITHPAAIDRRIYAAWKCGDSNDKYRKVITDMYQDKFKYRRVHFIEQFQTHHGSEPSTKAETERVIKSMCVHKGGSWFMKGTVVS